MALGFDHHRCPWCGNVITNRTAFCEVNKFGKIETPCEDAQQEYWLWLKEKPLEDGLSWVYDEQGRIIGAEVEEPIDNALVNREYIDGIWLKGSSNVRGG